MAEGVNSVVVFITLVVASYLIGSVSFAVLVSRMMGLPNPHSYGSGNPGATNVLRSGSKKAAILTLLGDGAKGGFALWLASRFVASGWSQTTDVEMVLAAVALGAFLGHLFPVYYGFRGGKGVATAAGILLVLDPVMGAAILGIWILVAVITRYSSLAAIVAAVAAPILALVFLGKSWFALAVLCMSLLLLWRHRDNISKLFAGTESRIKLGSR